MNRRRIEAIARAISDGHPVDWESLTGHSQPEDHRTLQHLRSLAALAARQPAAENAVTPHADRPLAWTRRVVAALAAAQVVLALVSLAATVWAGSVGFAVLLQGSAAVALLVCATVLIRFGTDARAQNLAALLLLLASAASQRFLQPFEDGWLAPLASGLFPDAFLPCFAWAFVRDFPRVLRFSRLDTVARFMVVVSGLAGFALAVANLAIAWAPSFALPLLTGFERGGTSRYWAIVFGLMAPALIVMLARIRHAASAERRRVALFLGGLGAGLLPVVLIVALELTSDAFDRLTSEPKYLAVVDAIIYASVLSIPFTTTYAVLVQRVLAVSVVIRRTLQYALARQTLMFATTLPLALLGYRIFTNRHLTIAALFAGPDATAAAALAAAGLVLLVTRRRLIAFLDRRYFREEADLTGALGGLVAALAHARDGRHVAELVERAVGMALQVDRVALYTREGDVFMPVRGRGAPLHGDSALLAIMEASSDAVDLEAGGLATLLPGGDRAWAAQNGIAAVVPVTSEEQVVAFVAVGPRRNDLGFGSEAATFLSMAAASAGLALSRSALHAASTDPGGASDVEQDFAAECETCGTVSPPQARVCTCGGQLRAAAVPQVLSGKFLVTKRLGAGGMGVVYRALDRTLGREVALKALPRLGPAAASRLLQEAQAMARVAHTGLATIHGVESWRGNPILVIELLEGGTLAERIRRGPLPVDEAVTITMQVAGCLLHLHRHGLLHRDIKPGNIGFTAGGRLKLLDFGLAAALEDPAPHGGDGTGSDDEASTVAGTPMYLPPEAFEGARPSPAFDLWGAALVLYEAMTGQHPFRSGRYQLPNVRTVRPDCPAPLAAFLSRALAVSPASRPPTAEIFLRDLTAAAPPGIQRLGADRLLRNAGFDV